MSRIAYFATAAAVIVLVSAATLFFGGTDVGAQAGFNATPVLVVNDARSPVLVTDGQAMKRPFRQWVVIHLDGKDYRSEPLAKVPKGFQLHVTDFNFFGCSQELKDDMAVNLTLWPSDYPGMANPDVPPPTDEIPRTVLMILPRGVFQGMRHFGGSQQPNIFADEGEIVWVEAYRTSARLHAEGAAWVQGYFQQIGEIGTELPPGW